MEENTSNREGPQGAGVVSEQFGRLCNLALRSDDQQRSVQQTRVWRAPIRQHDQLLLVRAHRSCCLHLLDQERLHTSQAPKFAW